MLPVPLAMSGSIHRQRGMSVIDDEGILLGTVNMTAALKEIRKADTE